MIFLVIEKYDIYYLQKAIAAVNTEVEAVLMTAENLSQEKRQVRGTYDRFTAQERAVIAQSAMNTGVTNTIRKHNKKLSDQVLKESTVHAWVTQYKRELEFKKSAGVQSNVPITILEYKCLGRHYCFQRK